MSESHEFKIFDDKAKKRLLLTQIFDGEGQLFSLLVVSYSTDHPDYAEWKYEVDERKKALKILTDAYEDLGGTYDIQEIRNVLNNSQ
jgi:hypothetical protein